VEANRVVRRRSSHIFFLENRLTVGGDVVSLTSRPPFDLWYSFLLEAESISGQLKQILCRHTGTTSPNISSDHSCGDIRPKLKLLQAATSMEHAPYLKIIAFMRDKIVA
jgi:hypothetical protein